MGTDKADVIRKPMAGDVPLAQTLDALVREGELYEKLEGRRVRCFACGHRCVISEGARGICQVRYNRGGKLYVPHGYVAALQCDPTEKKPFFHILPGSDTLTFGMLGCDFHCGYCFTGDIRVVTSKGVLPLSQVFAESGKLQRTAEADIAYPVDLRTITASGSWRPVQKVFRHRYAGKIIAVRPYYLPPLRCTPEHRVYATLDPGRSEPEPVEAGHLTLGHYLAIPKHYAATEDQVIDIHDALEPIKPIFQVPHKLTQEEVRHLMEASDQGVTSRELGERFGMRADAVRHVRSKVSRGLWHTESTEGIVAEDGTVRFYKEKRPGIPSVIPLTHSLARLLGLYCAEGSIVRTRERPNSYVLNFSFGPTEQDLASSTRQLLQDVFGVTPRLGDRETTLAVAVSKSSIAHLFQRLCGAKAGGKHVPPQLFMAPDDLVDSFLHAYIEGDGHNYPNGKVSVTTTSEDLAFGVSFLALRLGYLPSIYENALQPGKQIQGRSVKQAESQHTVVWYADRTVPRRYCESDKFYFVPLRSIAREDFDGEVYNMEVDEEHNYLANFFLVKNCQNWLTSQTLRDAHAGVEPMPVSAEQLVALGRRYGARLVGSSYNEPLITSEWAVEVFKVARESGFRCVYISNGNTTREALEYIRPYVDGYKIDLKTMSDKSYRQLGGVLQNVLDSVKRVHEMGFWEEIVTLIVPGFNDSTEELMDAARYIRSVSPDIPWHVTAFHQDYRMTDKNNTTTQTLIRAAEIGQEAGLHYVYAGNLPGQVGPYENTYCPKCNTLLVERYGYRITQDKLSGRGTCPKCGEVIPGIWE